MYSCNEVKQNENKRIQNHKRIIQKSKRRSLDNGRRKRH